MSNKFYSPEMPQPALFTLQESTGRIELFPAVWNAAEQLIHPDLEIRRNGLEQLIELQAHRFSSLIAYLIATRLTDQDISLRAQIIEALGEVLIPDNEGQPAPDEVRLKLITYLSQLHTREIFSILQVLAEHIELEDIVTRLLDACPFAGTHLMDILTDRSAALEVRIRAVEQIGRVGYLDALPQLERLESRLESRMNGQRSMSFVPLSKSEDQELLPAIHRAITLLREP